MNIIHFYYTFYIVNIQLNEMSDIFEKFNFKSLKKGSFMEPNRIYYDGHTECSWTYEINLESDHFGIEILISNLLNELEYEIKQFYKLKNKFKHLEIDHKIVFSSQGYPKKNIGLYLNSQLCKKLYDLELNFELDLN